MGSELFDQRIQVENVQNIGKKQCFVKDFEKNNIEITTPSYLKIWTKLLLKCAKDLMGAEFLIFALFIAQTHAKMAIFLIFGTLRTNGQKNKN